MFWSTAAGEAEQSNNESFPDGLVEMPLNARRPRGVGQLALTHIGGPFLRKKHSYPIP
jgi:hypothetical protein